MRRKSDALSTLTAFYSYVSMQFGRPILALQTDNGKEFDNLAFRTFLSHHDIVFGLTCPYTSQQNGRAKRVLRTLNDCVRTLLFHGNVPPRFWPDALTNASLLLNIRPCRPRWNYAPHHLLFGTLPSYDTTKKYTSVMIRVCHSRSRFLSCMYIHDKFMTEIKIVIPVLS